MPLCGNRPDSRPPRLLDSRHAEPSPEPELVFTQPADCTAILPDTRVGTLEAQGLTLLGGPGSLYGDEYFGDQTPEQLIGGMSCVWGQEGVGPAIYNLITDDAWFSVLNSLGGQTGFDESVLFTEEMRGVAYGAIE